MFPASHPPLLVLWGSREKALVDVMIKQYSIKFTLCQDIYLLLSKIIGISFAYKDFA
jgi:hypothetical protein